MHSILGFIVAIVIFGSPPPIASPSPSPTPLAPIPLTVGGLAWTTGQIARLHRTVDQLLTARTLRGAQIGFIVTDTVRGTVLYSRNADEEFMPASNFKLLVGSAALQSLGTSFAFVTTVAADAGVVNGTIHGNVYLRGGGDALLSANDLDDAAASLARQGIKRIEGDIVTDASRYDAQRYGYGWSWDDLPYYYAPVVSALELEDGTVHMTFAAGASVGAQAVLRVWPRSSTYSIDDELLTGPPGSKDTSDFARVWDLPRVIQVIGNYPVTAKTSNDVSPSVPDPESYAGDVLLRAVAAHGITVSGAVRDGKMPQSATSLWSHPSEAMPALLRDFWYPSDNLMGELFLKELGVAQAGQPGTDDHGRLLEQAYLRSIGVDPSTVTISDGSGLSQYDRITPRDLLLILRADWNNSNRNVILDALPVAGVRGTLRNSYIGTPAERRVFAKTGSISHVRTISGFVQTKTHGPITFSFLINQWMGEDQSTGSADLAKARGAVFTALANQ
jgi:serine-type D-Ala-D-Ala carboxypeptidase/endopeptidase (penicillin-binding protein 4)